MGSSIQDIWFEGSHLVPVADFSLFFCVTPSRESVGQIFCHGWIGLIITVAKMGHSIGLICGKDLGR